MVKDFFDSGKNEAHFQPTNVAEVQSSDFPQIQSTNLPQPQSANLSQPQSANLSQPQSANLPPIQSTNLPVHVPSSQLDQLQVQSMLVLDTDPELQLLGAVPHDMSVQNLNNMPLVNQAEHVLELDDDVLEHKDIIVHRELIRDEVVEIFQDPEILKYILHVTIIGNDGNPEEGSGRWVTLNMLTRFWQNVFDSLTVGTQEKIPSIRHDYQKSQWQAIARILVYGYYREKYFPIRLSPAFIAATLFGEECVSKEFLLQSFQLYISAEEKETLLAALAGDLSLDDEDLLDFLSNYKCYRCISITKDNISQTVNELAHQEIIQKPRYIIDCFSNTTGLLKVYSPFQSVNSLKEMYDMKKPTSRKVIKLLAANPSTEAEHTCLDHLKRYIRSLEGSAVNQFLAFVTGSDVIVCENISVSFVELVGVATRPVVHTCGPVLELPSTYQTYNELAEEFNFVIKDTLAWGFTIV